MIPASLLSARQVRAIVALLECDSQAEAATRARVPLRTLERWLTEPHFSAELSTRQSRMIAAVALELSRGAGACARALRRAGAAADKTARGPRLDPGRVQAARAVLDFMTTYSESAGLLARIEALETAIAGRDAIARSGGLTQ